MKFYYALLALLGLAILFATGALGPDISVSQHTYGGGGGGGGGGGVNKFMPRLVCLYSAIWISGTAIPCIHFLICCLCLVLLDF